MSKRTPNSYRNVIVNNDQDESFTVRGWNAENSRREREAAITRQAQTQTQTHESSHSAKVKRMVAAGALAITAVIGVRAAQARHDTNPVKIDVIAKPGDSPWSLTERAAQKMGFEGDIRPEVDQVSHEPQVADGLLPGEHVQVELDK